VPNPGDPQSLNRYAYVQNNPLKYTDPSGHALWAGEDWDTPSLPAGPPPWDSLAPRAVSGSKEALYIHAHNLGLAPWQDNPNGSIDDRFNPFYMEMAITGVEITSHYHDWYVQEIGEELYKLYGGKGNLFNLVATQCAEDYCNNPLIYGDGHFSRINPEAEDAALMAIIGNNNRAIDLFLDTFSGIGRMGQDVEPYEWNYEPLWLSELMVQYPNRLLDAQFKYLQMYELIGDSMDPEVSGDFPDFVE